MSQFELAVDKKKATVIVSAIIIVVLVGFMAFASVKFVDAGYRGVLTHWGSVDFSQPPLQSGMHFVTPFQDDIIPVNIQVQAQAEQASSASKDLQIVSATVTVNYHVDPDKVNWLYQNVGADYAAKIINPAVQEIVKAVTANYNAEELITERPLVKDAIEEAIKTRLSQFNLITDQVSITDFNFSDQFNQAIEAKVTAQQNALAAENTVLIKQAEAQQAVAEAQGQANATIIKAEGQAKAIQIVNEQLQNNPNYIQWMLANEWNGQLPNVMSGQNGILPLLNIPAQGVTSNGK